VSVGAQTLVARGASMAVPSSPEHLMLHYALIFVVVALVAALLGFSGLATGALGLAHLLAMLFIVLAVLALAAGLLRGR
jgi:uncharacterized membrane protein YtjA (UPF0391 family)